MAAAVESYRPLGSIAQQLEAQGYVLTAPLQRRPGVYLADVRAGPAGYQRLIIDDRNGEILERFTAPPRNWGPTFALRDGEFAGSPPPGFVHHRQAQDSQAPMAARGKSAYGGPTNAGIPRQSARSSHRRRRTTRPKPKSAATARKISPAKIAPAAPLTLRRRCRPPLRARRPSRTSRPALAQAGAEDPEFAGRE